MWPGFAAYQYVSLSFSSCKGASEYVQVRFAIGPLVGRELRRPEFAAGAAWIDDDSVGRPEDGGGGTALNAGYATEGGVVHADDLESLEAPIGEPRVGGSQGQRHGGAHTLDVAHAIERGGGQVKVWLDGHYCWPHNPDVSAGVLGNQGKAAGHHPAEVGSSEGDEKGGKGDAEKQTGVFEPVAKEHFERDEVQWFDAVGTPEEGFVLW